MRGNTGNVMRILGSNGMIWRDSGTAPSDIMFDGQCCVEGIRCSFGSRE